jgi:hypothetical protein
MPSVFICYRRNDTADISGRLYDRLTKRFGRGSVFKDVFAIDLGADFQVVVKQQLERSSVVLVLIGDRWDVGRLGETRDPVRFELQCAQHLNLRIIPVFVRGAAMPTAVSFPPNLAEFSRRNGLSLRGDPDFDADVSLLLDAIAKQKKGTLKWGTMALGCGFLGIVFALWPLLEGTPKLNETPEFEAPDRIFANDLLEDQAPICTVDPTTGEVGPCAYHSISECESVRKRSSASHSLVCRSRPASLAVVQSSNGVGAFLSTEQCEVLREEGMSYSDSRPCRWLQVDRFSAH